MLINILAHDDPQNSVRIFVNPSLPSNDVYLLYRTDRLDVSDRTESLHIKQGFILLKTPYAYHFELLKYDDGRIDQSSVASNCEAAACWMLLQSDAEEETMFRLGFVKIFLDKKLRKLSVVAPVAYTLKTDLNQYWSETP